MHSLIRSFLSILILTTFITIKYVHSAECPADDFTPVPGSGIQNLLKKF